MIAHCENHESLYIVSSISHYRRVRSKEISSPAGTKVESISFKNLGTKSTREEFKECVGRLLFHAVSFVSFKAKVVSSESVRNAAELHCFIKNRDAVRV